MDLAYCKDRLLAAGASFDAGLKSDEFSAIEREYDFQFPPDLREFLGYALPVSKGWLDWRRERRCEIMRRLDWPLEGMCFDIEQNAFWLDSWVPSPRFWKMLVPSPARPFNLRLVSYLSMVIDFCRTARVNQVIQCFRLSNGHHLLRLRFV